MSSLRKLTERTAVVGATLFGELSKNTEAHFDRRATENKVFDWLLRAHQAVGGEVSLWATWWAKDGVKPILRYQATYCARFGRSRRAG